MNRSNLVRIHQKMKKTIIIISLLFVFVSLLGCNEIGRYQIVNIVNKDGSNSMFMIDTKTGETWIRKHDYTKGYYFASVNIENLSHEALR